MTQPMSTSSAGQWVLATIAVICAAAAHHVGHTAESGALFAAGLLIATRAVENRARASQEHQQ
jgi:hypothetical protein